MGENIFTQFWLQEFIFLVWFLWFEVKEKSYFQGHSGHNIAEDKVFINIHISDMLGVRSTHKGTWVKIIRDSIFSQNIRIVEISNQSLPLSKGGKRELSNHSAIQCNLPYLDSRIHWSVLVRVTDSRIYWSVLMRVINSRIHWSALVRVTNSRIHWSVLVRVPDSRILWNVQVRVPDYSVYLQCMCHGSWNQH